MKTIDIRNTISNPYIAGKLQQFLIGTNNAFISDNSGIYTDSYEVEIGKDIVVAFYAPKTNPEDVKIRIYDYTSKTQQVIDIDSVREARKYVWDVEYKIDIDGVKPFKGYIRLHKNFDLDIIDSKTGKVHHCGHCKEYCREVTLDKPIWIFNMDTDVSEGLRIISATMI